jgi:hypothetical protein
VKFFSSVDDLRKLPLHLARANEQINLSLTRGLRGLIDVRHDSDSDQTLKRSEMTRCAKTVVENRETSPDEFHLHQRRSGFSSTCIWNDVI